MCNICAGLTQPRVSNIPVIVPSATRGKGISPTAEARDASTCNISHGSEGKREYKLAVSMLTIAQKIKQINVEIFIFT